MKFKYQARNKNGELQVGIVDAPSKDAAVGVLNSHELYVLSMESQETKGLRNTVFNLVNRVKTKDVMVFARQLATLVESEVPLGDALRILQRQVSNPILREVTLQLFQDIESGLALSQALDRHKDVFSDFFVSMVRSAEVTGRLEQSLLFLADYLEKEAEWKGKIINALIYPVILLVLFLVVGGIMVVVVFPKIQSVFVESNVQMPIFSRIVFSAGGFVAQWWWLLLLGLGMFIFIAFDYIRSDEGKAVLGEITLRLPVFGKLFKKIYITRFAQSFSVLIQGGIPVTQAIEIAGDTISNAAYKDAFHHIAQGVREGGLFSQLLLSYTKFFPEMVGQMTAIGETTGRIDAIMLKIADFYGREANNMLGNLSELLQPVLVAIMGVLVAVLFASILTPIYNLAQSFTM
jgi:type IV pilus assembly protein PilC